MDLNAEQTRCGDVSRVCKKCRREAVPVLFPLFNDLAIDFTSNRLRSSLQSFAERRTQLRLPRVNDTYA